MWQIPILQTNTYMNIANLKMAHHTVKTKKAPEIVSQRPASSIKWILNHGFL